MGLVTNMIKAGDYKNGDIKLKGLKSDKPTLICRGLLGKTEIPLGKNTIKEINHTTVSHAEHQLEIIWKNGKKSLAVVDNSTYTAISAKMF